MMEETVCQSAKRLQRYKPLKSVVGPGRVGLGRVAHTEISLTTEELASLVNESKLPFVLRNDFVSFKLPIFILLMYPESLFGSSLSRRGDQ